jgi:hypothetical protein
MTVDPRTILDYNNILERSATVELTYPVRGLLEFITSFITFGGLFFLSFSFLEPMCQARTAD